MSVRVTGADHLQRGDGMSAVFKADKVNGSLMIDIDLQPLTEGVNDRGADTVQTARYLIGTAAELAAGMKDGKDGFDRTLACL